MTLSSNSIRAVFFDLGETLFQPLDNWVTSGNIAKLAGTVQIPIGGDELITQYRKLREEVTLDFAKRSFYLHKDFVNEAMSRLFEHYELEDAKKVIEDFAYAQRDAVIQYLKPQSDCFEVLKDLRDQKFKLAIVSNIDDDWLDPLIEIWKLDSYVDFILSSETAQSCKPDSSIFMQASHALDIVPHQTIFVGDSFVNDVVGASNVGMHPVWLNQHDAQPTQKLSVPQIETLSALLELL
ncbi:MAG: HAD family hydrolase [Gammaproteobacteria bacterium]|nr:HAD family hydrolase [Gammaproteobacteria bacterium]MYF38342.1 HAD family hydrolase [Gammaproteobacteria bacterium]